jgi:hypothetical protein
VLVAQIDVAEGEVCLATMYSPHDSTYPRKLMIFFSEAVLACLRIAPKSSPQHQVRFHSQIGKAVQ